jgi:hypothetical protein
MATATTTVTCNEQTYTKLTTASTGYALIYNPIEGSNLAIYNGASAPAPATQARMILNPDDAFQRTADITDHLWGKLVSGEDVKIVVTQ